MNNLKISTVGVAQIQENMTSSPTWNKPKWYNWRRFIPEQNSHRPIVISVESKALACKDFVS